MSEIDRPDPGAEVESVWGIQVADRVVSRYASVAARDAGIPTQEGQVCYVIDIDELQVFNGLVWNAVIVADGSAVMTGQLDMGVNKITNIDDLELSGATTFIHNTIGGDLIFRIGATNAVTIKEFQMVVPPGNAAAPGITFPGDLGTGIYQGGGGQINFTASGAQVGDWRSAFLLVGTGLTGDARLQPNGVVAAPTYSFFGDPDSGFYRRGADSLAITLGNEDFMWWVKGNGTYLRIMQPTASSGNVFADGSNRLDKSTSSLAGKANIKNLSAKAAAEMVAMLRPIRFTSKHAGDKERGKDETAFVNQYVGFGAEEVFKEAAEEENYDIRAIVAALVKVVQGLM